MAFSSIFRRLASSFKPLAVRALQSQQNCQSAIFTALNQTRIISSEPCLSPFLPPHRYSTKRPSADENLLLFLESEIHYVERTNDHNRVKETPGGFPFKIEDKLGFETITLSREYQGEEIKVIVRMHDVMTGEDGGDDNQDADEEKANQWSIPLVVSIAKGIEQYIEFKCTANPNKLLIARLATKNPEYSKEEIVYEGPYVLDSDDLQKAFRNYLEIRGIKPSMTNFLREYMINKGRKRFFLFLKNLKKFVEA